MTLRRSARRRSPSPLRGTGAAAGPLRGIASTVAFVAMLGSTAGAGEICRGRPSPGDLTYSLSIDAERHATATEVWASFRLLEAAAPQDVAMLLFADGVQVLGPNPVLRADCGETLRWRIRIPSPDDVPLDLHATAHPSPDLPTAFAADGDRIPSNVEALRYAYDAADVATTAFGPRRDPPPGTAAGGAEIVTAPLADAYLYDGEPDEPVHVRVLERGEERWTFRIWFGETLRRGGRFGITCLLDDRQFDAFEGRALWFGELASGEAAIIPARTPDLSPGWHQVRCLVLDSLFAGADRPVAWPYVIRSTFLYRRP